MQRKNAAADNEQNGNSAPNQIIFNLLNELALDSCSGRVLKHAINLCRMAYRVVCMRISLNQLLQFSNGIAKEVTLNQQTNRCRNFFRAIDLRARMAAVGIHSHSLMHSFYSVLFHWNDHQYRTLWQHECDAHCVNKMHRMLKLVSFISVDACVVLSWCVKCNDRQP